MSVLLIDIGNTRVKWAHLNGGRLGKQRAEAHAGWAAADFERRVLAPARDVEKVVVASVAAKTLERALHRAALRVGGVAPEFIKTSRHAAGVTTLYREPWRLGVDRFIAAIGAHKLLPGQAVCVVDVGTAMTIDVVDARGLHRGGVIAPGPDLMVSSLLQDTSGIQRRAAGGTAGNSFLARNTRSAVQQGARYAAASLIDRAVEESRRSLNRKPHLVMTGGAVTQVRKLVSSPHQVVPDLVLRGLAAML